MAKKTTPNKKRRNPGTTPAPAPLMQRLKKQILLLRGYCRADNVQFIIGLFVLVISIFLLISVVSNVFTGRFDQSYVQSGTLTHAANYGGKLGAYLSDYLMNTCFGLFAILIPVFLLLVGVKLINTYSVRLWKWFVNLSIIMIWGSIFMSLVTQMLPKSLVKNVGFSLGGNHGSYITRQLTDNLGSFGAWIVVLVAAVLYLMYLTSETVNVVRRMLRPQDYIKDKLAKRKEHEADSDYAVADEGSLSDEATEGSHSASSDDDDEDDENAPYYSDEELKASSENGDSDESVSIELGTEVSSTTPTTDSGNMEIVVSHNDEADSPAAGSTDTKLDITTPIVDDKAKGKTVEEVLSMEPYDPRKTERLTIDFDIQFYNYHTEEHSEMENIVVIELKRDGRCHSPILPMLRQLRIKPAGFSKYCIGASVTDEGLHINRFKKRLIKIRKIQQAHAMS